MHKKLFFFLIIIITELFFFSEILVPCSWGNLKVEGLACTCPDLRVKTGKVYLKSITPDSLKKFNIDYSEIYLTENSYQKFPKNELPDAIFDESIIEGKVVGKRKIDGEDDWNLVFEVIKWKPQDILVSYIVKILFVIQLIIFGILWFKEKKKSQTL